MKEKDLIALGFEKVIDTHDHEIDSTIPPLVFFTKGDFISSTEEEATENDGNYTITMYGSEFDYCFSDNEDIQLLFNILNRATSTQVDLNFGLDAFQDLS